MRPACDQRDRRDYPLSGILPSVLAMRKLVAYRATTTFPDNTGLGTKS